MTSPLASLPSTSRFQAYLLTHSLHRRDDGSSGDTAGFLEKARQRAAQFEGGSDYKTETEERTSELKAEIEELKTRCDHLESENTELKVALKKAEEDNKELKEQDRKNQREIGEAHGELRRLLLKEKEERRGDDRRRY